MFWPDSVVIPVIGQIAAGSVSAIGLRRYNCASREMWRFPTGCQANRGKHRVMSKQPVETTRAGQTSHDHDETVSSAVPPPVAKPLPKEIGGRDGLEPTLYGDWEKNGRCVDF